MTNIIITGASSGFGALAARALAIRWEDVFRAQGMKNPTPRIQMIEGFNAGWIEFEGDSKAPSKGRPRSKPPSKKWFGMLANRPHRLRNFLFYKEKNSEDTTNDEVHSWRRDRGGSHLLLRFVERTSKGEEDE